MNPILYSSDETQTPTTVRDNGLAEKSQIPSANSATCEREPAELEGSQTLHNIGVTSRGNPLHNSYRSGTQEGASGCQAIPQLRLVKRTLDLEGKPPWKRNEASRRRNCVQLQTRQGWSRTPSTRKLCNDLRRLLILQVEQDLSQRAAHEEFGLALSSLLPTVATQLCQRGAQRAELVHLLLLLLRLPRRARTRSDLRENGFFRRPERRGPLRHQSRKALTAHSTGRGVFCPCRASYRAFFLGSSGRVRVGRRAAPPLFAHCGETSRPVPSRRSSAHVAAMNGAVAPAASQRLQSRHQHATTCQQLEFWDKCDSACCAEPKRLVVVVGVIDWSDSVRFGSGPVGCVEGGVAEGERGEGWWWCCCWGAAGWWWRGWWWCGCLSMCGSVTTHARVQLFLSRSVHAHRCLRLD